MNGTSPAGDAARGRPLAGVRVVEAGIALAGPFCGSLLADFGATVIKVERPEGGDPARLLGPRVKEVPLWWGVASRDKLCVSLDLKAATDRERFLALIEDADVLVENYRPGVMERLGLDWAALSARNPRLVMMSISGFGRTGPDARRPGFGKIAEGLSGIVPLTGSPDRPPLHVGFSLADTSAGLMGCMAITMALLDRDRNGGRGARIDVGLYEPLLRMTELQFALRDASGMAPRRSGSNDPYGWGADEAAAPASRRFVAAACSDGEILVLVDAASRPALVRLCHLEPAHGDGGDGDVDAALRGWAAQRRVDAAGQALRAAGIEAARIHDGRSMAATAYFLERGDVVEVADATVGKLRVPGRLPLGGDAQGPAFHAASVGEHDAQVFRPAPASPR
jgi:crotonobetainyl-CoA:carnitine CoA-transferase CaiB-like acyl-CoA transferase